jgi:hypothetical protein
MSVVEFERKIESVLDHYKHIATVVAAQLRALQNDVDKVIIKSDKPLPGFFPEMIVESGFHVGCCLDLTEIHVMERKAKKAKVNDSP